VKRDILSPLVGIAVAVIAYASGLIPVEDTPWLLILALGGGWLFGRAHNDD
jgi:hypothetical protein